MPFAAAEAMGQQHRHMAGELAAAALDQQGQPGKECIGAQAPEPHLGDLGKFAGIVGLAGPVEGDRQILGGSHQLGRRQSHQGLQGGQIEPTYLGRGDGQEPGAGGEGAIKSCDRAGPQGGP